jgi:hypothetical protein
MKFNINKFFFKILILFLYACQFKPTKCESFEWYKLKTERNLIYLHIFEIIQFDTEMCGLNFHNCVFDLDKNTDAIKYNSEKTSEECFPIKKSSYCLQKKHFDLDCPFQLVSKQVHFYKNRLEKKFETCSLWYPSKYTDVNKTKYDGQQSNSSKSSHAYYYSIFIPFCLFLFNFFDE